MTLRLNGSTSGYTEIDAPAVAGNNTLKLPTGNGSDGSILGSDGAGNLSWVNGRMVLATSQASTSGTAIDFTGIPSWVKRVTVMFNGVSTNGASIVQVQIGAGSVQNTGYISRIASTPISSGFGVAGSTASVLRIGSLIISNVSGNTWVMQGNVEDSVTAFSHTGSVTLSGTLDRIRITTVNGTDTFDAGSIGLLYEG